LCKANKIKKQFLKSIECIAKKIISTKKIKK